MEQLPESEGTDAFVARSRLVEWATADQNVRWVEHRLAAEGDPRWRVRRLGPGGRASVVSGPRDAVFNTSIGLGLEGAASEEELGRLVDEAVGVFREVGALPALELSPYARPEVFRAAARRGFVFDRCYQAYLLDLRDGGAWAEEGGGGGGVRVERVGPGDREGRELAIRTIVRGFEWRDPEGNGLDAARLAVETPSTATFLAWVGGEPAGGGCVGISGVEGERVAYLFSTSVRAEHRRRGVHTELVRARLRWAAGEGAGYACVDSVPGLWTERTVRRLGFELLYTKPVLVLPDRV